MQNKKLLTLIAATMLAVSGSLVACGPQGPAKDPTITVDANVLVLSEKSLVALGQEVQLTATLKDVEGTITWTSSNTNVASVTDGGIVKGLAVGDATITAAIGDVTGTIDITVKERSFNLTANEDWTAAEKETMEDGINYIIPFMAFGDDYTITYNQDAEMLSLEDTYVSDLTDDYAAVLVENGFEKEEGAYVLELDHGNTLTVEMEFNADSGNAVDFIFDVAIYRPAAWPAAEIAAFIGDKGHGIVVPEVQMVANPDYVSYMYYYVGDVMVVFASNNVENYEKTYSEALINAGFSYTYFEDYDAGQASTWEQDVVVITRAQLDSETNKQFGYMIQIILDEPVDLVDEFPTEQVNNYINTNIFENFTDAIVAAEDKNNRGFNVIARDLEWYVKRYEGKYTREQMEYFWQSGQLPKDINVFAYDPDGSVFAAYKEALTTAGWTFTAGADEGFAYSANKQYMVRFMTGANEFQVIFTEMPEYPAEDIALYVGAFANAYGEGTNTVVPETEGYEYYFDEENYALYINTPNTNAAAEYAAKLTGWALTGDDESGYYAVSPDQQIALFFYYDVDEYGYPALIIQILPAVEFYSFPSVRVAAILNALVEGTTTYIPEIATEYVELDDGAGQGSPATLTATVESKEVADNYVGALQTGGYTVTIDEETKVVTALSPDGKIQLTLSFDEENLTCTMVIARYIEFGNEWPATVIATNLGANVTDVLPAYVLGEGETVKYAADTNGDGHFVYVDVDDATIDAKLEGYAATLTGAKFTKDEATGYYVSENAQFYADIAVETINGNKVIAIRYRAIQYFTRALMNQLQTAIGVAAENVLEIPLPDAGLDAVYGANLMQANVSYYTIQNMPEGYLTTYYQAFATYLTGEVAQFTLLGNGSIYGISGYWFSRDYADGSTIQICYSPLSQTSVQVIILYWAAE